jgi:hypothetical protein
MAHGIPSSRIPASPFQAQGEISPGKTHCLHRTIAGSTPFPFGRESFAVIGPLALVHGASYPISVRRLADSLPASSGAGLTARDTPALRFAWGRCDQLPQRTFTSELWVMLGTPKQKPRTSLSGASSSSILLRERY